MDGRNLLAQVELCREQRMAQSLAPGLRKLLTQVEWQPRDVELVAATLGPGSFTGLRIGITTAKMFAYAVGADVLGIDTLETIAAGAPDDIRALTAVVDAQRGEVVAGDFQRDAEGWLRPVGTAQLVDIDTWLASLPVGTVLTGPVLKKLADRVPDGVTMLDESHWIPKARAVARLAARDYAAGRRDDLFELAPRYSRRSAAEEKLDDKVQ